MRLDDALDRVRATRPLLVGLDFDGVLAPIVERPMDARPLPGTMAAVSALAAVDGVTVVLVSGRAVDVLGSLTGIAAGGPVLLVGSHGAEMGPNSTPLLLDDAARERLAQVQARLEALAAEHPGAHVETKPASAVLHTRPLDAAEAEVVTGEALALLADVPGVHVMRGKEVVEAAVVETSKGAAMARLRDRLAAAAVVYLGDDVTDETVFTALRAADVGVKVGEGPTAAAYRIAGPSDVRDLLVRLAEPA